MFYSKKSRAFSLTEVLIVLVIIASLFAAMAPIITKRHSKDMVESESVWNFVANDDDYDSYFDPGVRTWTSSAYIGKIPTNNENAAKLVINSGDLVYDDDAFNQHQLQFRYGSGRGLNAGSVLLKNTNLLFGSDYSKSSGFDNTAMGISALSTPIYPRNSVAIGNYAMEQAKSSENANSHIIALGDNAGRYIGSSVENSGKVDSIFVGANSGASSYAPDNNIAIGANSMHSLNTQGNGNVFVGADTGAGFASADSNYNIVLGSKFFGGDNASYNNILGYGTYTNINPNVSNMTAIGYGACNSIPYSGGEVKGTNICLGYNSAVLSNNSPAALESDEGEHVYIGGMPLGGFPGRSVLEVHTYNNDATVIMNSNLVVRGKFYPNNNNGEVSYNSMTKTSDISRFSNNAENLYYKCSNDYFDGNILNTYAGFLCSELKPVEARSANIMESKGSCGSGYTNGGNCPNILSDINLKENISANNDGLSKLLLLKPYIFSFKSDPDKALHVGVIAQDLQKIFPNSVSKDNNGYLKIRWDEMFYALINSIKELNAKIELAVSKISEIKSNILLVKSDQKDIKKQISKLNSRVKRLERK